MTDESIRDAKSTPSSRNVYSVSTHMLIEHVYHNTKTNAYLITHDKLLNILNEHNSKVGKRMAWTTPLLFIVSLILTLVTSDFKKKAFLSADTWTAVYYLVTVAAIIWFLKASIDAIMNWRGTSTKALINQIKDNGE